MPWSTSSRSKGSPTAAAAAARRSASAPSSATASRNPSACSIRPRARRASSRSSTSSACQPAAAQTPGNAVVTVRPIASRAVNQKLLPCPGSLVTPISPSIISASRRVIASPRPLPPKRLVVDASACEKASNSVPCRSRAMPMPLSRTLNRSIAASLSLVRHSTRTSTDPTAVNFTALLTRLTSACINRVGSPARASGAPSASTISSSPLRRAPSTTMATLRDNTVRSEKSTRSSSSLPDSIFERSRMSLIRCSRWWAASAILLTRSRISGSCTSRISRCAIPITAFSGVRISWLMLARNALFARLAASARWRACARSVLVRSSWACVSFSSVTSWATNRKPCCTPVRMSGIRCTSEWWSAPVRGSVVW